jgi:NitT/TauT family transport system permease protein
VRTLARLLAGWWPFVLLLAAWQGWIALDRVQQIVAPSPAAVAAELARNPALYGSEAVATLAVAIAGLATGVALACALAVATWFSPFATGALTLPALLVQSTPLVALLPVVARLLGYDERAVVASAALITVFPSFVLVAAGLRALPRGADEVFAALGAGRRARLVLLAIPSGVPSLLVALRIAAPASVLAALIAEYLMGTSGLGQLFAVAEGQLDTARAWTAALVATALSVAAYLAARRAESVWGRRFRS